MCLYTFIDDKSELLFGCNKSNFKIKQFIRIASVDKSEILRERLVSKDVFFKDRYIETPVSEGRISYMVEGIRNYDAEEHTDLRAILDNYVSVGIVTNIS